MKKTLFFLLSFLLPALTMASCIDDDDAAAGDSVGIGSPLPNFTVTLSDGSTVSTADLQGAPSVIVFFHTLCGDCQRELPVVERFSHEFPGVRFLCIARSQGKEEISAYWQKNGLTLSFSPQPDAVVYNLFANSYIPRVYVSDASCIVRQVFVEELDEEAFRQMLQTLNAENSK
ncbi:MAG: TlpA family protein disulfide reductase [Prevotellamassilia sp.]|nr:TlpA family protein disulfide reductase [Prevotellamassilia sp.]